MIFTFLILIAASWLVVAPAGSSNSATASQFRWQKWIHSKSRWISASLPPLGSVSSRPERKGSPDVTGLLQNKSLHQKVRPKTKSGTGNSKDHPTGPALVEGEVEARHGPPNDKVVKLTTKTKKENAALRGILL